MSEKPLPFVINDRRKFNPDGEPRESAEHAETPHAEASSAENLVEMPAPAAEPEPAGAQRNARQTSSAEQDEDPGAEELPPGPTAEQMEQSKRAFEATAERLDTALRAANPGADHPPALTFESLIQSVYMQAVLQLGGGGSQLGEQAQSSMQIDLMGARQSIDMLSILAEKTHGNLSQAEETLLSSAIFELRLAFLEMTQALARSAQQRHPGGPGAPGGPGFPPGRPGPSIVR